VSIACASRTNSLGAFDGYVIDEELLARDQPTEVESERLDVLFEIASRLLEAHEHAGLVEPDRAPDQELRREQRLAAAGGPAHQGRPSRREPAERDLV
jgi:hypothetical protein